MEKDLSLIALLDMIVTIVIGRSDEDIQINNTLQNSVYKMQREGVTPESVKEFKEVWEKLEAAQALLTKEMYRRCLDKGFYYNNLKKKTV